MNGPPVQPPRAGQLAGDRPGILSAWEGTPRVPWCGVCLHGYAPARVSGQRHCPESAVTLVGVILLLREVGFSLAEQQALLASRGVALDEWRRLAERKLAELDEQIAKAGAAREAIEHAMRCPHQDILQCPNFGSLITARLAGQPLRESHPH